MKMKESGNKLIRNNEYKESIAVYTDALNVCPLCFNEDRSILFANRAVAKLKLVSISRTDAQFRPRWDSEFRNIRREGG